MMLGIAYGCRKSYLDSCENCAKTLPGTYVLFGC